MMRNSKESNKRKTALMFLFIVVFVGMSCLFYLKNDVIVERREKISAENIETTAMIAKSNIKKTTTNNVAVKSVSLNKTSITVEVGKKKTLIATANPSNANNKTITWTSKNPKIASVNSSGVISGVSAGKTTITATSSNGKKATTNVTVKNVAVKSISIKSSMTVIIGKSKTLDVTFNPSNATNKTIKWTSSNKSVATVDSKGNVKGLKIGTAKITATSNNGKTSTCTVKVVKEELKIYFYNTKLKSDAILVISGKTAMVVDGGFYADERDHTNNRNGFIDFIRSKKDSGEFDSIEYYVASHGHEDHITSAGDIIKTFNINNVIVPVGSFDDQTRWYKYKGITYKNYTLASMLSRVSEAKGITKTEAQITAERDAIVNANIMEFKAFDEFKLGTSKITVLNPTKSNWPKDLNNNFMPLTNKNSLVLRIDHGKTSFLLSGDAASDEAYDEMDKYIKRKGKSNLLNVDIYKNGHHHYKMLTNSGKLRSRIKKVNPQVVVMTHDDSKNNSETIKQSKTIKDICIYSVTKGTVEITSNGCKIKIASPKPPINESKCSVNLNKC